MGLLRVGLLRVGLVGLAQLVATGEARAGVCGSELFKVHVPGNVLPLNGHVLLELSTPYSTLIDAANVQFASEAGSIAASVVKRLTGKYGGTQLLLTPSTPLTAGTQYHLAFSPPASVLGSLSPEDQRTLSELTERSTQWFAFTTTDQRDDEAPTWTRAPTPGAYTLHDGPKGTTLDAFDVRVRLGPDFHGFVLAHIEKRTEREPALDVLFPVSGEKTQVGLTDCYSQFLPTRGTYAISLTAIDLGGNQAQAPGKPFLLWFGKH